MHEGKRIIGVAERVVGISLGAIIAATVLPCSAFTASAAPAAGTAAATSPKIRELMTSLAQEWLDEQGVARPSATPPPQAANSSLDDYLNSGADAIHDQIVALAGAIPALPHEFERAAARVTAIDPDSGRGELFLDLGIFGDRYMVATRRLAAEAQALLNIALFGVFGYGALWLFRKMTGGVRHRLDGLPVDTVNDRLRVIATRSAFTFGAIAAFILGSLAPLFALDMDPVRRTMVSGFLIVFVAIWIAIATGKLLLAPMMSVFGSFRWIRQPLSSGAGDLPHPPAGLPSDG